MKKNTEKASFIPENLILPRGKCLMNFKHKIQPKKNVIFTS